jgi:hypothetical protein
MVAHTHSCYVARDWILATGRWKNENENGGCCKFVAGFGADGMAQYSDRFMNPLWTPYFQELEYRDTTAAERDLRDEKKRRDQAREERELTGKSDQGARGRLEAECTRALERGVENSVRRSYGCGD